MITIVQQVLDDIRDHARSEAPRECCGVLIGRDGRILELVRARNLASGTTRFELDPLDHIRAMRDARLRQLEVVGFYHSHPRTPAWPSPTDIAECGYFGVMHLIAGVGEAGPEMRLFTIDGETITELSYTATAASSQPLDLSDTCQTPSVGAPGSSQASSGEG